MPDYSAFSDRKSWDRYGGGNADYDSEPTTDTTYSWSPLDRSRYDRYAQQQQSFSGDWFDALKAGKESYAEAQMQRGIGQAQRGMASAAVARGANPAQERAAMMGGAQMQAQAVGDAAALRAQEMAAARAQYAGTLSELRGGEMGWEQMSLAQQQAAAQHYAQMAGLGVQERGQDMQMIGSIVGAGGAAAGAMMSDAALKRAIAGVSPGAQDEIARALARPALGQPTRESAGGYSRSLRTAHDLEAAVLAAELEQANAWRPGAAGRVATANGGGVASAYGRSPHPEDELSRSLELRSYRYGPEARALGAPAGERLGPMAQDLERSALGRSAVVPLPAGRGIDRDQALGISLGLHGRETERLDQQEAELARLRRLMEARQGGPQAYAIPPGIHDTTRRI